MVLKFRYFTAIENRLETTKTELAKTSGELSKMDTLVNDLATKLDGKIFEFMKFLWILKTFELLSISENE